MISSKLLNIASGETGFSAPLLQWFIETSFSIALLIALVLIIRKPVSRYFGPKAAYMLWALPPLRLALPELSILPRPEGTQQPVFISAESLYSPVKIIPVETFSISSYLIPSLSILWIACAVLWLFSQLANQSLYQKELLKNVRKASPETLADINKIIAHYGGKQDYEIYEAIDETGPLVTGFLKPVIVVPKSFHTEYSDVERRLALSHEIMHIKRGDLLIALAAMVFRAFQWPNPMVHLAWRAFRSDQEAACDAAVLESAMPTTKNKHAYASAIVKAAKQNSLTVHPNQATVLPLAHEVKERLMLMKKSPNRKRRFAGSVAASAIIAVGLGSTAQYGYAKQDAEPVTVKEQTDENVFINKEVDGKTIIIKKITSSSEGENVNINIKTIDDIEEISLKGDSLMVFHAKTDEDCAKLEAALSEHIPDTGIKDKTKSKDKKVKTKSVMVFSGTDKDGNHTASDINLGAHKIVCKDGKLLETSSHTPEMELEHLRKAIEHLKEEEEHAAERIREARKRLEERLAELEKETADQ